MQFTWVNGRRLKTISYNGNTYAMSYDNNGMRTQKGNTRYYYDSSNNLVGMTKNNKTLFFYYDESGAPTSFSYNGLMHYYIKNLQGDVMKIVNYNGVTIASYSYDVSGKVLSVKNSMGYDVTNSATHIGNISPFRYRGYVYDFETGLYYLQSRYYDPVTTRFINADVYSDTDSGSLLSTNMFAYCENNSMLSSDPTGYYKKPNYNIGEFNCYAYAMGYSDKWMNPGKGVKNSDGSMSDYFSVIQVRDWVLKDFKKIKSKGKAYVRKLNSKKSKINSGEYRVAVRVSFYRYAVGVTPMVKGKKSVIKYELRTEDFHFMKQNPKTKEWWEKRGTGSPKNLGKINPDSNKYWKKSNLIAGGYYSNTLYLAVKDKFWGK